MAAGVIEKPVYLLLILFVMIVRVELSSTTQAERGGVHPVL